MNRKTLILSMLISAFVLVSFNLDVPGEFGLPFGSNSIEGASLDLGDLGDGDVVSFALGNVLIFFVLSGAVYLFLRGVGRSFGRFSGDNE
jgi:hypothetical protein